MLSAESVPPRSMLTSERPSWPFLSSTLVWGCSLGSAFERAQHLSSILNYLTVKKSVTNNFIQFSPHIYLSALFRELRDTKRAFQHV